MNILKRTRSCKRVFVIFLIIGLGTFLRIIDLQRPSFHWDEAQMARMAQLLVDRGYSPWDTLGQSTTTVYLTAIPVALFGANEISVRSIPVLAGCLCLVVFYFLAKHWYDRRTAILGCCILAFMPIHVLNSRFAQLDTLQTTFLMSAILCFELGLHKVRQSYIAASGVLAGLSFFTKYNAIEIQFLYLAMVFITMQSKPFRAVLYHFLGFGISLVILYFRHYFRFVVSIGGFLFLAANSAHRNVFLELARRPIMGSRFYFWVLLDGLSFTAFFTLILGCIYFIIRILKKNAERNDMVIVVTLVVYFFIVFFQGRFHARYMVLASPFMAIVIARSLLESQKHLPMKKWLYIGVFALIIANMGWNYSQVTYQDWTVEREVGEYVRSILDSHDFVYADQDSPLSYYIGGNIPGRALKTIPEARQSYLLSKYRLAKVNSEGIFVQQEPTHLGWGMVQFRYEPLVYHDGEMVYKLAPQIGKGLLVITTLRDEKTHISSMGSGPLDIHTHQRHRKYVLSPEMTQLKAFLNRNYPLLKEFYYRNDPVVQVYEIES